MTHCRCGAARVIRGSSEPMILACLHCDRPCARDADSCMQCAALLRRVTP